MYTNKQTGGPACGGFPFFIAIHKPIMQSGTETIKRYQIMRKTRLQISLSPEVREVLKDISVYTKTAPSTFASKVLEDSLPVLRELLEALRVSEKDKEKAFNMITQSANKSLLSSTEKMLKFEQSRDVKDLEK